MNLNRGRHHLSIPGPSVIPDRVLSAMNRPMPNIYEGDLVETSQSNIDRLPAVARTKGQAFISVSNGHGAWEMALTNTLSRGDKVLILASGRFAPGWGAQAEMLGCVAETIDFGDRGWVDPQQVEDHLRADTSHEIKAVLVVQIDTASGVWNDIAAIRKAIDAAGHPALYMVDTIASLGCVPYEMDAWGVDITVGGSQKGLMVPPGLGFIWASDKALEAHKSADMRTPYWDITARQGDGGHYVRYCGTPPIQHIYGLREALDMIDEEGLDAIWARHAIFAKAVRAAVSEWATDGGIEFNIPDAAHRSDSTTTILTGAIDSDRLRQIAEDQCGMTLGVGLGDFAGRAFRIGHMGHLNPPMILGTLGTVEAALAAMGAPVGGSGVASAASVIAGALAARPASTTAAPTADCCG